MKGAHGTAALLQRPGSFGPLALSHPEEGASALVSPGQTSDEGHTGRSPDFSEFKLMQTRERCAGFFVCRVTGTEFSGRHR
jgi:hypothetical protein